MKTVHLGAIAALSVSISMVAACQLSTPNKVDSEGVINAGNSGIKGTTVKPRTAVAPAADANVQVGDATVRGKVLDKDGNPVAGATVMSGSSRTVTAADGSYTLTLVAGEAVDIKVVKDGYILRDSALSIAKGENLAITTALVKADPAITHISATAGGTAVSADGKSQLIIPAGALKGDADVRVTWLNPVENTQKPAAFKIQALADTGATGGTADDTAAPGDAPTVTSINTTDLPGPLETKAYGDRKFFSPVSFAAITMSNALKDGESATLRMAISQEVLDDMFRQGDLKDADLGQDIFPCFAWSADESTWDKPALSKVVKDEKGKYWFEYTVRASSLSPAIAKYQTFAVGDAQGSAKVELQVGGGRRVVDGTFTYGALVERSSNASYDFHGFSNQRLTAAHYSSPTVGNLIRPDVTTTNYTGTTYASTMGADDFGKWDREGMFRLAYPPGAGYRIVPPLMFGVAADGPRTGTTATASQQYLTPDPTGRSNATQTQGIAATYVKPFYYYTDATLTLQLDVPGGTTGSFHLSYTLDGATKDADVTATNNQITTTIARNAYGSAQHFVLKSLDGNGFGKDDTSSAVADLPPGSRKTLQVKMVAKGAK